MTCWPAAQYREILAVRKSPKAQGAPREKEVLLLDVASPTQALAKMRVRINDMVSSITCPTTGSAANGW